MRGESFHNQLQIDSWALRTDPRMHSWLVDKVILQLSKGSPQILTDNEVHRLQTLDVPNCVRLADLCTSLQEKGEEACHQLYCALHLYAEKVYFSLPTRAPRAGIQYPVKPRKVLKPGERFVLNDKGPNFFLHCFSLALGGAVIYYYCEKFALTRGTRKVLMLAVLSLGPPVMGLFLPFTGL